MATKRDVSLVVTNLRPLLTALRRTAGESPKEVGLYHKRIADLVATQSAHAANTRPRKIHTGHIAASIRARGTQREATVQVRADDALVQEFGGRAPLFGNRLFWHQVRPKRKDGYFLYPTIRRMRPAIEKLYLEGLQKAISRYWKT